MSSKHLMLAGEVGDLLGIDPKGLTRLVDAGQLTVRRVPGCRARYFRSEVERLADEWTQPRTAPAAAPPGRRPPSRPAVASPSPVG